LFSDSWGIPDFRQNVKKISEILLFSRACLHSVPALVVIPAKAGTQT